MENFIPEILEDLLEGPVPPCLAQDVPGMTSPKMRLFLNRLARKLPPDEAYLEIGTHRGATLISALLDNKNVTAYACDDFSGFREAGDPEIDFKANWERYKERLPDITFYKMDSFELSKQDAPFKKPIGIYFYDGFHDSKTQYQAIVEYARFLSKKSIIIIDDWNWEWVRKSTWDGVRAIRPKSTWFKEILSKGDADNNGFWNGICAFYIRSE